MYDREKTETIKTLLRSFKACVRPIKGRGSILLCQRTIAYSIWIMSVSVIMSVIIEICGTQASGWLLIKDYSIGIACSLLVVCLTMALQFVSERDASFRKLHSIIFRLMSILLLSLDNNSNLSEEQGQRLVDEIEVLFEEFDSIEYGLFWYDYYKYSKYIELCKLITKIRLVFLDSKKTFREKINNLKMEDIKQCLVFARDLFDGFSSMNVNVFQNLLDSGV